MQGLSQEVYESAAIDGAGKIKSFFRITVPMLGTNIVFVSILATINSFKVFDQINILTQGGPGLSTNTLVYAIYYYSFRKQNVGYASAIAVVLFLIIFIISMIQMKIRKKVKI